MRRHPGIREHHGRYQVRYYGSDGKEHAKSFARLSDALRWQRNNRTDLDRGNWIDPAKGAETLAECYGRWAARAQSTGHPTERTLIGYDEVWRRYIKPAVGSRRLASLTREDCQSVVDSATSAWRAMDVRKVLSRILSFAVRDECITRNPGAALDVPKLEQREPWVLTLDEVERLADAIEPSYRALVLVGAFGSLRWSELVGLRVGDVDFLRRRVRVERKIVEAGKLIAGEPKTKGSRRWVSLPESVVLAVASHVEELPEAPSFLFPGPGGGPLRRKAFRRVWAAATTAAGISGFQFRNLRHTGATWALQEGVSPVLVAFRLGHRSTRMIEQHYGRLIESMDAEIAERLERTRTNADQMRTKPGEES